MKVRISYTVDVDDKDRRAINLQYGRRTPATRKEVQEFFRDFGENNEVLADLRYQLDHSEGLPC